MSPPSSGSKKQAEQETSMKAGGILLATCFHADYIPEDGTLQIHHRENLKSHIQLLSHVSH
jgi:hypothetical protein